MADQMLSKFVNQRVSNPYPDENVNPSLKLEKEYYLRYGKAMIADYVNNVCELPYEFGKDKRTFKELHEYATGTYSNYKLKDSIIGKGPNRKKNGRWITKMNISWDTLPVLSKMLDIMREKNMRQDYDVDAYCIDDDSIQAKAEDKAMLQYLVQKETKEFIAATKFKPNFKLDPQALGLQNEEDVDLYFECGAYVFDRELASIAACNKTKLVSNYKIIQDQTFDDLIKYSMAFWKNEIDITSQTVRIRKCEVYNQEIGRCPLVIPFMNSNGFERLPMFGEIRTITIADIRQKYPHLTAEHIIYLAESYQYLNTSFSTAISNVRNSYNSVGSGYNLDPINRCKVLVFDYQWLGVDVKNYIKNEPRSVYKEVDFDFKLSNERKRKGDKQIQKKVVKKFGAEWVIGTDILLNYGQAEDIIYYGPDGDRCPSLDFFGAKTGSASLIERCISIQDDIDLANIKLRNAISTAVPAPRMIIQTGLLDNVFLNNIKQQPEDNMATFRELGYLMVNAVDDEGKPLFSNQKLVDFLPMGIQEDINVFTGQILAGINNLREVLGIAQGADGSTPQKYDGVRKTELAAQSSNASLFPTFNCYQYLFEAAFTDVVKKWQIIAKDRDIKLAYSPLGQKNLKVLSLNKEFTNSDLNIALTLGSTQQELDALLADIRQLKALGIQTNFVQGITASEYLYLTETIKSGNVKQAMWVMAKVEKKKIAAQQMIEQRNQEKNAQDQQNSAAQAELNKQKTAQVEGKQDRMTEMLTGAQQRKTAAANKILGLTAEQLAAGAGQQYQQILDECNRDVQMILLFDQQPENAQQQGEQPEQEQQMVA